MIPVKTSAGQQVLKDRSVALTPRQRAVFILIDGKRSLDDVLQSTAAAGVTREDVDRLFELGLVADSSPAIELAAAAAAAAAAVADPRTPQQRYAEAYPLATKLTASLGLRGVRLNLAVEGATSYEDLLALSPKIREAVGADKFAPLARALGKG
jgi:hypothetical protein